MLLPRKLSVSSRSSRMTKELGYVGIYGEILGWVTQIHQATGGDARIQARLEKLARAHSLFRYPTVDGEGYRAMVLETVVGWRDSHYPGDVDYGIRNSQAGRPPARRRRSRTR
jgi:hypothetical protein